MARRIKDMYDFKQAIHQISIWAHNSTMGLLYEDIELFIKAVFVYSKLGGREKMNYYRPLDEYFKNKKDVIREHLLKNYGSQAKMMANNIHLSIYGKPWAIESEKKYFKDIYTAISEFALRHKGDVEKFLRSMGFRRPHTVIKKMENELLGDIQIGLKRMNDPRALKIVIQHKSALHNAFMVLFQSIDKIGKAMNLPPSSLKADEKIVGEFIKDIEPLVDAEIEAKEALLPAA